jgi:predicted CXXCH cytochrome family protein
MRSRVAGWLSACGATLALIPGSSTPAPAAGRAVPAAVQPCAGCHTEIVTSFLGHGMSRSLGPAGGVTAGVVTNPSSRNRYALSTGAQGPLLTATFPDGGIRRQRIVGRIGAGIFDTSWVGAEVDGQGAVTGRLFFAPVETLTGRGLALSPFELHSGSPGMDAALDATCLTCHTTDRAERLPGAAAPAPPTPRVRAMPSNHLGADAFQHLSPLTCTACHGDTSRHADITSGKAEAREGEVGLRRLGRLTPGVQRDVCARCHLQGDTRIEFPGVNAAGDGPLAGRIPVLVPRRALADEFRFVGQLERLALSACFKASPAMTCTTCHRPHSGVAAQGVQSFDAACVKCHAKVTPGHTSLTVSGVAGHPARGPAGCVDCHVRRSAPFDLPHVRSADHFIQRRIRPPRLDVGHRQFADPGGEVVVFDDGRLVSTLATADGRRWQAGVLAMALLPMLRVKEAAAHFEKFPPPGSPEARRPNAPAGLVPLETEPSFHLSRGLALMASGAFDAARAAFSDAIVLDPLAAEARLARARLALGMGDVRAALVDTQAVIDAYPKAEQPWDLRVELARRAGRPDLARSALDASTRLWPSNARAWLELGLLLQQRGDTERARRALDRARALSPSLVKPAER